MFGARHLVGSRRSRESRGRMRTATLIRFGLAAALCFPLLYFVGWYLITYGTFDGLLVAFVDTSLASFLEWISAALAHPIQAVLYSVVLGALSRWTFRRRR